MSICLSKLIYRNKAFNNYNSWYSIYSFKSKFCITLLRFIASTEVSLHANSTSFSTFLSLVKMKEMMLLLVGGNRYDPPRFFARNRLVVVHDGICVVQSRQKTGQKLVFLEIGNGFSREIYIN
jgi:hypothetical protein